MKGRTAAILVGCTLLVGFGYSAFGYKLTVGNLLGVKIKQIVLVDLVDKKAFDEKGNAIPTSDPDVHGMLDYPSVPRNRRQLHMSVAGAKSVRIRFGDREWQTYDVTDGVAVFNYPVIRDSSSVKYEIQAATDDWQQIDSWQGQKNSGNYHVRAEGKYSPMIVSNIFSYKSDANTRYRLDVKSSDPKQANNCWNGTSELGYLEFYFNSPLSTIQQVRLSKLHYRTIQTGYIAFGAVGSPVKVAKPDHSIKVLGVMQRDQKDWNLYHKWSTEGNLLSAEPNDRSIMDMSHLGKGRHTTVMVEVGETENYPVIRTVKSPNYEQNGYDTRTSNDSGHTSFNLAVFSKPEVKTIDMTVEYAAGPFQEVARFGVPSLAKENPKEPGRAVIIPAPILKGYEPRQYSLVAKLPDEFRGHNLELRYIGKDGNEYGTGMTGVDDDYAILLFESPKIDPGDIKGFVVRARKYKSHTFKGIHLYPSTK